MIVAAVLIAPRPGSVPDSLTAADQQLLDAPTRGDLAGDQAFVTTAVTTWTHSHRSSDNAGRGIFDHMLGRPTVVWAGTTPAGKAAYPVQAADLREHADVALEREGPALLWGFVGPGPDGDPAVNADGYPVPGAASLLAAFLGPERDVLLVADRAEPGQLTWGITYSPDGRASRTWQPLRFADGVAVVRRPTGADPASARLRIGSEAAEIGNAAGAARGQADQRLQWMDADRRPLFPVGTVPGEAWPGRRLPTADAAGQALTDVTAPLLKPAARDAYSQGDSLWFAAGSTPDGSRLVAGEQTLEDDPSRVYAVLTRPGQRARVVAGPVDRDAAVPVRLRLPDGQGRLVAAKGKTFAWTVGGVTHTTRDAALIPAGGTDATADGTPIPAS